MSREVGRYYCGCGGIVHISLDREISPTVVVHCRNCGKHVSQTAEDLVATERRYQEQKKLSQGGIQHG